MPIPSKGTSLNCLSLTSKRDTQVAQQTLSALDFFLVHLINLSIRVSGQHFRSSGLPYQCPGLDFEPGTQLSNLENFTRHRNSTHTQDYVASGCLCQHIQLQKHLYETLAKSSHCEPTVTSDHPSVTKLISQNPSPSHSAALANLHYRSMLLPLVLQCLLVPDCKSN